MILECDAVGYVARYVKFLECDAVGYVTRYVKFLECDAEGYVTLYILLNLIPSYISFPFLLRIEILLEL